MKGDQLKLELQPAFPSYLVGESKEVICTFLGAISVTYQFNKAAAVIPGSYIVDSYDIIYIDGTTCHITGSVIKGPAAEDIRNLKVKEIIVKLTI